MGEEAIMALAAKHGVFGDESWAHDYVLLTDIVPTPELAVLLAIHQNGFADLLRADQAVVSVLDRVQSWRDA